MLGQIVGLRNGRAEYGPRALGHSSIIADPREQSMHDKLNKIKQRESFRPYAPSILTEYLNEYFEISTESPFMSIAGKVRSDKKNKIPAVVHVDGSARYQTVSKANKNSLFRSVLEYFYKMTGIPVLLNTSFNIAGQPIVETPTDTLDTYQRSGLDCLVLDSWLLTRN